MRSLLLLLLASLSESVRLPTGEVLCSVEEYVRVGLEFESCQKEAMERYLKGGEEKDLCPAIKKMETVCSSTVKRCFTPRGFERGRQIFFDSMSQAMPEIKQCATVKAAAAGVDELRAGERCSVRQEIDSVQAATRCSTAMKAQIASMVRSRGVLRGGFDADSGTFSFVDGEDEAYEDSNEVDGGDGGQEIVRRQRDILCRVLGGIKERCLLPNLRRCYIGHDYDSHLAYLLESLKISGNLIAIALTNVTDVPDCPVFSVGPVVEADDRDRRILYNAVDSGAVVAPLSTGDGDSQKDAAAVTLLATLLAVVVAVVLLVLLALLVAKLRLVPRIKAWASNVPYDDMLVQPGKDRGVDVDDSRNVQAMQRRSSERETEDRRSDPRPSTISV